MSFVAVLGMGVAWGVCRVIWCMALLTQSAARGEASCCRSPAPVSAGVRRCLLRFGIGRRRWGAKLGRRRHSLSRWCWCGVGWTGGVVCGSLRCQGCWRGWGQCGDLLWGFVLGSTVLFVFAHWAMLCSRSFWARAAACLVGLPVPRWAVTLRCNTLGDWCCVHCLVQGGRWCG